MRPQTKRAIMMATMVNASPCASVMSLSAASHALGAAFLDVCSPRASGMPVQASRARHIAAALLRRARANLGHTVQSFAVYGRNGSEGGGKSMWAVRSMAAMALAAAGALQAQDYPSRPVRLIVASSSGSGVDIIARVVAQRMTEALGVQMVVDNRAGAGGT